eukprot:7120762-Pyramimonas_sp.AAC.2
MHSMVLQRAGVQPDTPPHQHQQSIHVKVPIMCSLFSRTVYTQAQANEHASVATGTITIPGSHHITPQHESAARVCHAGLNQRSAVSDAAPPLDSCEHTHTPGNPS